MFESLQVRLAEYLRMLLDSIYKASNIISSSREKNIIYLIIS